MLTILLPFTPVSVRIAEVPTWPEKTNLTFG